MSDVEIRRFREEDLEAVKSLNIESIQEFGDSFRRPTFPDLDNIEEVYLKNNGEFIVAINNRKVVAIGGLKKLSDERVEVRRMRVHPNFQRQGIGKIILGKLEQRARELGYKVLELDTSINQPGAQEFCRKNGYLETKREGQNEGWPVETIFYEKRLNS